MRLLQVRHLVRSVAAKFGGLGVLEDEANLAEEPISLELVQGGLELRWCVVAEDLERVRLPVLIGDRDLDLPRGVVPAQLADDAQKLVHSRLPILCLYLCCKTFRIHVVDRI